MKIETNVRACAASKQLYRHDNDKQTQHSTIFSFWNRHIYLSVGKQRRVVVGSSEGCQGGFVGRKLDKCKPL